MHRTIRTILAAVLTLAAGIGAAQVYARPHRIVFVRTTNPVQEDAAVAPCSLMMKINELQEQLSGVTLQVGTKDITYSEIRAGRARVFHDPEKQIMLGLLNPTTCTTRIITITKRGNKLIAPAGYDIEAVRRANGIQWNNWATEYRVNQPDSWFVIANEYPYVKEDGKKRTVKRTVINIFYTPYGPELAQPEYVAAGQRYLLDLADRAIQELKRAGVPSRAFPGMQVADVPHLRPEYFARLAADEHMDQTEFLLDPQWTTDRIFAIIGINGDHFASYTCSPAAACGLMQFTSGTYTTMARAYPEAALIRDFTTGARDPLNSMKAAVLLHDYNLASLRQDLTPAQFEQILADEALTEELPGSSYNTGESRTAATYKAFLANPRKFSDWATAQGRLRSAHLLNETKGYIAKLRYIRDTWPSRQISRADQAPNP